LVAAALILGAARPVGAQGAPARLIGDVVSSEGGIPLAHSMVTVIGLERQTFTSDGGIFVFSGLDPGKYRIRAAHIGYTPTDVSVEIVAGAEPPRLKIALKRISVQLATVKIVATSVCRTPGRPNPDIEPDFAAIVGQLRMNAEQFQLLSDSFPYKYKVDQQFYEMKGDSSRTHESVESEEFRSDTRGWEYKMGQVVEQSHDGRTIMHLPTLRDFASYEFLNNHCFTFGGVETTRDGSFIRIGFQADVQIRTPDVSGTVYLDAKTYQIRRADLELTKMPRELPEATAIHVTTIFGEVAPSIDIIQQVRGITSLRHHGWGAMVARGEDQRMFGLEWLGADPSHPRVQP
jgi:hypothetical protein